MSLSTLWEPHFQTKLLTLAAKWVTNNKHQRKTFEASKVGYTNPALFLKPRNVWSPLEAATRCNVVRLVSRRAPTELGVFQNDLLMLRGRNTTSCSAETALQRAALPDHLHLHYPHWPQHWWGHFFMWLKPEAQAEWTEPGVLQQHNIRTKQPSRAQTQGIARGGKVQEGLSLRATLTWDSACNSYRDPFGPVTCSCSHHSCDTSLNGLHQPITPWTSPSKTSFSSRVPQSLIRDIPVLPGSLESTAHGYEPEGTQETAWSLPAGSEVLLCFR